MKSLNEIQSLRMIKVSFIPPTTYLGARVRITETQRYNDQKTESKVFGYDYEIADIQRQAIDILERNGFNVVSRASEYKFYILLCDNWGDNFINIKDLK